MNRTLLSVIAGLLALILGLLGWWANRTTTSIDSLTATVAELKWKFEYTQGRSWSPPGDAAKEIEGRRAEIAAPVPSHTAHP